MEETAESLLMTVHLLADSGHGLLLQQAVDQLLDCICPEVRLFLVSERARPMNYYEKTQPRRSRFPGMSVLLFLHVNFREERLFRVLDSLQLPPWQGYATQQAQGRRCPYLPANQEFYSLHHQMPVWGVRQVQGGPEILRVTLYCSFDNYEDAIRLYEMILQRDATLQKSNFCYFLLYATEGFHLQLSLKQLPLGMSVDPKESSVLQFKVQEIGQLVPLLPHPCVPISSTRWQTQDYDGNKILLQVPPKPGVGFRNGELCFLSAALGADVHRPVSRLSSVPTSRTLEARGRRSRSRRFKVRSLELPEPRGPSDGTPGPLWKSLSQAGSSAPGPRPHLPAVLLEPGARMSALKETDFQNLEAETNVDTGFTTIRSEPRSSFLSRLPRHRPPHQPIPCLPGASLEGTASRSKRDQSLPLPAPGDLGARKTIPKCSLPPVQAGEKEEEFFI